MSPTAYHAELAAYRRRRRSADFASVVFAIAGVMGLVFYVLVRLAEIAP